MRLNENDDLEQPGKRSPLVYVLVVLVVVFVALLCALAYVASPLYDHDSAQLQQPTEIANIENNQEIDAGTETQSPSMSAQMQAARSDVEGLVASYGDSVAVAVLPLDGSAGFSINGEEPFVSASMIKLPILATYLQQLSEGTIDGNDSYTLKSSDIVGGTGVLQNSSPGASFTYDALAKNMIKHSDNTATNILINILGMDAINAQAQQLGLDGTSLNRIMMDLDSGLENYITADDCALILRKIAEGSLASAEASGIAEGYLLAQEDNLGLAQGLPSEIGFGHKTGSLDSVRHDGGIVYAENPYVIVVLTSLDSSTANSLMASISKKVYADLEG